MHYKNGREAHNGDKVVFIPSFGLPVAGILYDAVAGNNDCNGRIAIPSLNDQYPDLKECLHADDVAAAIIPDSTPAPQKIEAPAITASAEPPPSAEVKPIPGYVPNEAEARANASYAESLKRRTPQQTELN
jgi:hypothetical protein